MQSESPYWLDESYSTTITKSDIGMLGRNLQMADVTKRLLLMCFPVTGKFVDYGGGYGLFVRLMRDQGFDFYRHDPLCENIFAEGFDAPTDDKYDLLTAWEVFEHLVDPMSEIETMLNYSENLLFSTTLLPRSPKPLDQWWYYGLEHGQHVALYSYETLALIAKHFGAQLYSDRQFFHLLTSKPVPRWIFKAILNRWGRLFLKSVLNRRLAGRSLLAADYEKMGGLPAS